MGFRFQRRVTLFPGVRLNFSRRGISTSIGPRGASITLGPRGAALNLGIPGTGLSFRHQLTHGAGQPALTPQELPSSPVAPATNATTIESAPVSEVTSEGLESLKELVVQALAERAALQKSVPVARIELARAERRLRRAKNWFFGIFIGRQVPARQTAVKEKAADLKGQEEKLNGAFIDVEFMLDDESKAAFAAMTETFEQLTTSERIWDITEEAYQDRRVTRSSASTIVDRKSVQFTICEDEVLQSGTKVLRLGNANGADLLIYPGFMMMTARGDIAFVELRDVKLNYRVERFVERDPVPSDAEVVDYTWAKCNKDGSPDRRFANNYRIPVAGYGGYEITSSGGIREAYQISDAKKADRFARAFVDFQNKLRALGQKAPTPEPKTLPNTDGSAEKVEGAGSKVGGAAGSSKSDGAVVKWTCIPFLQSAEATSTQHGLDVYQQFITMLGADVKAFNGEQTIPALERFTNEAATIPGVAQAFFRRVPGGEAFAPQLLADLSTIISTMLDGVRVSVQKAGPEFAAGEDGKRLLRVLEDAKRVLAA
jgi:hypothetical protein